MPKTCLSDGALLVPRGCCRSQGSVVCRGTGSSIRQRRPIEVILVRPRGAGFPPGQSAALSAGQRLGCPHQVADPSRARLGGSRSRQQGMGTAGEDRGPALANMQSHDTASAQCSTPYPQYEHRAPEDVDCDRHVDSSLYSHMSSRRSARCAPLTCLCPASKIQIYRSARCTTHMHAWCAVTESVKTLMSDTAPCVVHASGFVDAWLPLRLPSVGVWHGSSSSSSMERLHQACHSQ